jgi:hypothetical protein
VAERGRPRGIGQTRLDPEEDGPVGDLPEPTPPEVPAPIEVPAPAPVPIARDPSETGLVERQTAWIRERSRVEQARAESASVADPKA